MKHNYIVWDWNGTIMDDIQVALDAVNDMLGIWGRPAISLETYRKAMVTPIIGFYEEFFDLKETPFTWITEHFNKYYHSHQRELTLHDGVREKLESFRKAGCRQVILSASSTEVIHDYVTGYGIDFYFEEILGAGDLLAESKIERAIHYFKNNQIDMKKALLIGDTVHDFEAASELGVDCILVSCGHQDRGTLYQCGCPVYDSVEQWEN